MCAHSNRKKHARRRRRAAETHWVERKANGICPMCQEPHTTSYLCETCSPHYYVLMTDVYNGRNNYASTQVWIFGMSEPVPDWVYS